MRIILLLVLALSLAACDKQGSTDSTKNRARAEEEANSEVQRKVLQEKAEKMEADLAKRQRFYSAVSGVFEGTMKDSVTKEALKIRFTFTPSLPPYFGDRVRELSEVEADLNNLYFNVQVIQWSDDGNNPDIAFGCVFQNIRPDLQTGQISLSGADCASVYLLYLADDGNIPSKDFAPVREKSAHIAGAVLDNTQGEVGAIKGMRQVTKSAAIFKLAVQRINP